MIGILALGGEHLGKRVQLMLESRYCLGDDVVFLSGERAARRLGPGDLVVVVGRVRLPGERGTLFRWEAGQAPVDCFLDPTAAERSLLENLNAPASSHSVPRAVFVGVRSSSLSSQPSSEVFEEVLQAVLWELCDRGVRVARAKAG
ncbi:MAG: hypothetical protein HY652_03690 [Acidobacteria bacterium]|nr:hypothetical protein [Acidobacteriota bacterium]